MIKFVYFDVGQVLVSNKKGFADFPREHGWGEKQANLVWDVWGRVSDKLCEGVMTEIEAIKFIEDNAAVKFGTNFSLIDATVDKFEPIAESQSLLRRASKKFGVGLLSNAYEGMLDKLSKQNKLPKINYSAIVDSFDVGMVKPNLNIFELATEKSGVDEDQILFIDDSKKHTETAKNFGWNVYRFDENNSEGCVREIKAILGL